MPNPNFAIRWPKKLRLHFLIFNWNVLQITKMFCFLHFWVETEKWKCVLASCTECRNYTWVDFSKVLFATFSIMAFSLMTFRIMTFSLMAFRTMTFSIMTFRTMTFSIMTFRIMTFSIMAFSLMTFSIMAFSIMTFSIMAFSIMTFSIMTFTIGITWQPVVDSMMTRFCHRKLEKQSTLTF